MIAKDIISGTISPLLLSDTANQALDLMEEFKLAQLPVVSSLNPNESILLGIISEENILNLDTLDISIDEIQELLSPFFINENQHVFDAIQSMAINKLTLLPVIGQNHKYIGVINARSIIKFLGKFTGINLSGGIIVLEMNKHDYSLSQIAQIIESNDAKVYSTYISSENDINSIDVTIKLSGENIDAIIQTFERYNYKIKYSFNSNKESVSKIEENYQSLMSYLNV